MDEIIHILMRRDGITENEAWSLVEECRDEIKDILEHDGTYDQVTNAIEDWLGLEPDYLECLI